MLVLPTLVKWLKAIKINYNRYNYIIHIFILQSLFILSLLVNETIQLNDNNNNNNIELDSFQQQQLPDHYSHHYHSSDSVNNHNDFREWLSPSLEAAAAAAAESASNKTTIKINKRKRFAPSTSFYQQQQHQHHPHHHQHQQQIDEPEFIGQIPNITVSIGRDAKFPCIVNNLDTYRVGWIRNEDKSILTIQHQVVTRNNRISLTQSEHKIWTLHIKNVQESDRGGYMCQINTMPMKSQIGYLDVTVPPDFINSETSSDVVVRENQNLTLRCKARGHPEPKLTWRREDNKPIEYGNWQLNKENGFVYPNSTEGETIHIEKISRLHMGAYLCIAQNGIPPSVSRRIVLQVNFPPMIWVPNQLLGASIGDQVVLQCDTEAFPLSLNYWTKEDRSSSSSSPSIIKNNVDDGHDNKNNNNHDDDEKQHTTSTSSSSSIKSSSIDSRTNGEIMIVNSDRYRITNQEQSYKVNMKLIIKKMTSDDFGTYRCHAKNSLGSTQGSIRIYEIHRQQSPLLSEQTSIMITSNRKKEPSTARILGLNDSSNDSMNQDYYSSKFIDHKCCLSIGYLISIFILLALIDIY